MRMHKFDLEDKKLEIKSEILRIAKILGKTPTMKDYKRNCFNGIGLEQVTYLFGRWSEAVKFSGLSPNPFQNPPHNNKVGKNALIAEFLRVANECKKIPCMHEFRSRSKYSWTPYKTTWGSWRDAINFIINNYCDDLSFDLKPANETIRDKSKGKILKYACPLEV